MNEITKNEAPIKSYQFGVGFNFTITTPRPLDAIDWVTLKDNIYHAVRSMDEQALYASIQQIKED